MSTTEETSNKAAFMRFHEAANTGDVEAMLLRIYPDIHLTVHDVIAEGDKVVGLTTVTGTHQGEFMGVAPTGKSVTYNEMFMFRFADGRVIETWGVVDVYAQMKQIGVIPA